jgi:hypothetical protein
MKKCCGTCTHGVASTEIIIECRRYPPTITKVEAAVPTGSTITSHFPLLHHEVWCGEWKPRTN